MAEYAITVVYGIKSRKITPAAAYHAGSKISDGYGPGIRPARKPSIDHELAASFRDHDPNWDPRMDRTTVSAREQERRDFIASMIPPLPQHKAMFRAIDELGEAPFGLTTFLRGPFIPGLGKNVPATFMERQIIEDAHISGSGDVLRNTGIDRDPRPKHRKPLDIARTWRVDNAVAQRIAAALTAISASQEVADHYRKAYEADPDSLIELEIIAGQLEAESALPDDDAMSNATRYFDDTDPEKAEAEAEGEVDPFDESDAPDMHGADRGFVQFVGLDDVRDQDYHDRRTGEVVFAHPACPWSLRQPKPLQEIGRALRSADTPDALKKACARLIEAKATLTAVQASVLWGIYFRTQERLHIRKYGHPSAKAKRFKARLTDRNPGSAPINFAQAAVAINQLSLGDRKYLLPILYKARRKAEQLAA